MPTLTPSPTVTGKGLFEGTTSWRARSDQSDRMAGVSYDHSELEFSATEANEWVGFFQYLITVLQTGGALAVRNQSGGTLAVGPVRISGYDVTNNKILISAANATGSAAAHLLLLTALSNNTDGVAYIGGDYVSTLDTSASSTGTAVYLAAGGGITLTAPTAADACEQRIGFVKTLSATGTIRGQITPPTKFGTSWLQAQAVTAAKIANATITDTQVAAANKDGASGTASMRTLGTGAAQACAGNDARLSDSRAPNGSAGGYLGGTYPSPTVTKVVGTTAGGEATEGDVGEVERAAIASSTNVATTATWQNVTSITLPAGDWDVSAALWMQLNGATINGICGLAISEHSDVTVTDHKFGDNVQNFLPPTATAYSGGSIPNYRVNSSGSKTMRLKVYAEFSAGNPQFQGRISARRMR